MQTIKVELAGGLFAYKKPKDYKPSRRNTNAWCFADLSVDISTQVLQIAQDYNQRIKQGKVRHHNSHPIHVQRFFEGLYLTGGRLMELQEHFELNLRLKDGKTWVEISKANEKHRAVGKKEVEIIDLALPIFNEAEQKMWQFITDGGMLSRSEDIFAFDEWGSISRSNMRQLIQNNFHATLRDEDGKPHQNHGITPHILRHMRAFSVLVNYGVPEPLAVKWFGWSDQRMLYYYAHIRKALNSSSQVAMLTRENLLTSLPIDLSKTIAQYL